VRTSSRGALTRGSTRRGRAGRGEREHRVGVTARRRGGQRPGGARRRSSCPGGTRTFSQRDMLPGRGDERREAQAADARVRRARSRRRRTRAGRRARTAGGTRPSRPGGRAGSARGSRASRARRTPAGRRSRATRAAEEAPPCDELRLRSTPWAFWRVSAREPSGLRFATSSSSAPGGGTRARRRSTTLRPSARCRGCSRPRAPCAARPGRRSRTTLIGAPSTERRGARARRQAAPGALDRRGRGCREGDRERGGERARQPPHRRSARVVTTASYTPGRSPPR
jgi:hypothetical protein